MHAAVNAAIASGADLNNPNGLGAALKSKAIILPPAAIAAGMAANKDTPAPSPDAAESPRGAVLGGGADGEDAMSPGPDSEGGAGGVAGAEGGAESPAGAPGAAMAPEDTTSDVDGYVARPCPELI